MAGEVHGDRFRLASGVQEATITHSAGVPSAAEPNGSLAIDFTNGVAYSRRGGVWYELLIAAIAALGTQSFIKAALDAQGRVTGYTVVSPTGTGNIVLQSSPDLTAPTIGGGTPINNFYNWGQISVSGTIAAGPGVDVSLIGSIGAVAALGDLTPWSPYGADPAGTGVIGVAAAGSGQLVFKIANFTASPVTGTWTVTAGTIH